MATGFLVLRTGPDQRVNDILATCTERGGGGGKNKAKPPYQPAGGGGFFCGGWLKLQGEWGGAIRKKFELTREVVS